MRKAIAFLAAATLAAALCLGGCAQKNASAGHSEKSAAKHKAGAKNSAGKTAHASAAEKTLGTLQDDICDLQKMPDIFFSPEMVIFMSSAMAPAGEPEMDYQTALNAALKDIEAQKAETRKEIKGKKLDPCKSTAKEISCDILFKDLAAIYDTGPAVIKSTADKMHIDRCGILTVDALIKGEPGDIKERFFAGRINGVWKVITFLGPEEKSIQP